MFKKIFLALVLIGAIGAGSLFYVFHNAKKELPQIMKLEDYKPLLVSQVYDRNNVKIGEFFIERRIMLPYEKMPKNLINAFLAAEDDQFFKHSGVNYLAILRAAIANFKAGQTVQGGSTITQQVAKTFFLTNEKKYMRKINELLLARDLEANLSKEDILFLYLNQIFFGQNSYGVEMAAQTYFRKPTDKLELGEMAMLAGLPKAPSAFSPVRNPERAKERQAYVLRRMADVGFITREVADAEIKKPVKVYFRDSSDDAALYFLDAVKQQLEKELGKDILDQKGLKIYTGLDIAKQREAKRAVTVGLKEIDKRQGFRGPLGTVTDPQEVGQFLFDTRAFLVGEKEPFRIITADGKFEELPALDVNYDLKAKGLPHYISVGQTAKAVVSKVDDKLGLVYVRMAELEGIIDFETMKWARKPNFDEMAQPVLLDKPSQALKMGDIILARLASDKFVTPERLLKDSPKDKKEKNKKKAVETVTYDFSRYVSFELDQEPEVEGALLSIDQETQDVLALVGGYSFFETKFGKKGSQYNRALDAKRQTGSAYKAIVYAAALDNGFNPSTPITDAPIVFEDEAEGQDQEAKVWKPANFSRSYAGDITMRNALVRSLNVPTVKILEQISVPFAVDYARRLGVFSKLNMDLSLGLGSSSLTLYEMTKVFSEFGRLGKRTRPILVRKVLDADAKVIVENLSLEKKFSEESENIERLFEDRRLSWLEGLSEQMANPEALAEKAKRSIDPHMFFEDPDQLMRPTTAYLISSLLKAAVEDRFATGARARAVGREVAGKTGSTNKYFDAWFIGYTGQIATGVWVGFDQEKTLGRGEVGGRAALPVWTDYMIKAHEGVPPGSIPVPPGIVFANIDAMTGRLPSSTSTNIVRQAFLEGTEPSSARDKQEEESDFLKQDLTE